ncbi:thioesterase family protein [Mumia qirimensis]|uniref:thioesterase family protein n=1 Tax=Mumia qirimensis TaxID=3234852 RepID=UPI00351D1468
MSRPAYAFDLDTASEPDLGASTTGARIRTAHLTHRWDTPNGTPNGGYVLATMLRAVAAGAAFPDPLVAAATYARPALPGPCTIATQVLREGRRVATYTATLAQDGTTATHLVASFTDRAAAHGPSSELGAPPALPAPDACPPFAPSSEFAAATINQHLDYRFATAPAWVGGVPSGDPIGEYWVRFTDERLIDHVALALLVDAYPPAFADLADHGDVSVQLTVHFHRTSTSPWVAGRVTTRHLVDGFHEEDMELWSSDGDLLAQSRQLVLFT